MRITGKLLKNTDTGKEFAARECLNNRHKDNCLILEAVDTEYHHPRDYVENLVGDDGNLKVMRELHDKEYPHNRRMIVNDEIDAS